MRTRRPRSVPTGSFESLVCSLAAGCPACGAELVAGEDDSATGCAYCGRRFLITHDGAVAQSYVEPRIDHDAALAKARGWLRSQGHRATRIGQGRWVLVPYWRYRAKAFKWFVARRAGRAGGATQRAGGAAQPETFRDLLVRPFDFTLPASGFASGLPSIGTRPEILTTRILRDAVCGWAQLPALATSWRQAQACGRQRVDRGTQPAGGTLQHERLTLLDERVELLYFPFFVLDYQFRASGRQVILDGWNGSVTAHFGDEDGTQPQAASSGGAGSGESPAAPGAGDTGDAAPGDAAPGDAAGSDQPGTVALLSARCPGCAHRLPAARQDRIHVCPACRRAWEINGRVLKEVRQHVVDNGIDLPGPTPPRPGADAGGPRLLPFWRVQAFASRWQQRPDRPRTEQQVLYVPAFEGRHIERMCQLGIHLTRAHPPFTHHDDWALQPQGCVIGRADAVRMAWVTLGAMVSPDATAFGRFIAHGELQVEDVSLLWIPFRAAGLYLREPLTGALVREVSTRPWDEPDLLAA